MSYTFREMVVPDRILDSIINYIESGVPTGGFLEAVINNDLSEACGRADPENLTILPAIVAFLYNHAPTECWGFATAHNRWVKKKLDENRQRSMWRNTDEDE